MLQLGKFFNMSNVKKEESQEEKGWQQHRRWNKYLTKAFRRRALLTDYSVMSDEGQFPVMYRKFDKPRVYYHPTCPALRFKNQKDEFVFEYDVYVEYLRIRPTCDQFHGCEICISALAEAPILDQRLLPVLRRRGSDAEDDEDSESSSSQESDQPKEGPLTREYHEYLRLPPQEIILGTLEVLRRRMYREQNTWELDSDLDVSQRVGLFVGRGEGREKLPRNRFYIREQVAQQGDVCSTGIDVRSQKVHDEDCPYLHLFSSTKWSFEQENGLEVQNEFIRYNRIQVAKCNDRVVSDLTVLNKGKIWRQYDNFGNLQAKGLGRDVIQQYCEMNDLFWSHSRTPWPPITNKQFREQIKRLPGANRKRKRKATGVKNGDNKSASGPKQGKRMAQAAKQTNK